MIPIHSLDIQNNKESNIVSKSECEIYEKRLYIRKRTMFVESFGREKERRRLIEGRGKLEDSVLWGFYLFFFLLDMRKLFVSSRISQIPISPTRFVFEFFFTVLLVS